MHLLCKILTRIERIRLGRTGDEWRSTISSVVVGMVVGAFSDVESGRYATLFGVWLRNKA